MREVRLGSLSVSRNSLETAAFVDLMVRFYRGEPPGTEPSGGAVPVGMFDGVPAVTNAGPMIAGVLDRKGLQNQPLYPRTIRRLNDTADPVAVIRNALSAQQDHTATIVVAGAPVNLLGVLAIPDGAGLVENKVQALVIAAGTESEPGFAELLERWPTQVVGADAALDLRWPVAAFEEDFSWASDHPVVDAYRSSGAGAASVPAHVAAAILHAVHPEEYFGLTGPAEGPGSYRRLTAEAGQRDRAILAIRERVGARPPEPRGGRGG
jgi:hypothetical protein